MNCKHVALIGLGLVSGIASSPSQADAQRIRSVIERRQRPGRGFWTDERTERNIRHARDYSRSLYYYSRYARYVEPHVARSESSNLGQCITAARKEVASRVKTTKSTDAQVALKTIEKHLDSAAKAQKALHAECSKDSMNKMACAKHCNTITKELDKAQAEHRALIRALELREQRQKKGNPANGKK